MSIEDKKEIKKIVRCTTECRRTGQYVEVDDGMGSTRKCPLFRWRVSVHEVDKASARSAARKFDPAWVSRVEFHLHPTFNDPIRSLEKGPFEVTEEGYGSFEMKIVLHFPEAHSNPPFTFYHILNLEKPRYEEHHNIIFHDVSDEYSELLCKDISPASLQQSQQQQQSAPRKRNRDDILDKEDGEAELLYGFDVNELTDRLYSLGGKDILRAVELVKRYRTKSSYITESDGEFHFDLYTLTPDAVHALWDLTGTCNGSRMSQS